jgi:NADH-quinone oxidoreductase subunit N
VTQQLLLGFLAIELASLSLYVLAGFDKTRPESAEAGLKYFLLGGMSAAFLLFGFSLLYGLTGSIELPQMAATLAQQGLTPLLLVALVMILVAFGFKAAAAPFHLWAPDVYEGAPIPAALKPACCGPAWAPWRAAWPRGTGRQAGCRCWR